MQVILKFLLATLAVCFGSGTLQARVWTSLNGVYTLEAEAITFNDSMVVLKRPTGQLVAVELAELSEADREFVKSKELKDDIHESIERMQTWTAKDGMKVRGRILGFGRKDLVVQRRAGKIHFNDKLLSELDPLHQKLVLKILSHLEQTKIEDEKQLEKWGKNIGGNPKTFTLEGVMMKLESGDEIGVPFFLFADKELETLKPGWDQWLEQHAKEDEVAQQQQSLMMSAQAMAYQQNQAQTQRVEMLKLGMLATVTGVVSIWEVGLQTGTGAYARRMSVMVPAQNSDIAVNMAMQRYPGYGVIGVRRASN